MDSGWASSSQTCLKKKHQNILELLARYLQIFLLSHKFGKSFSKMCIVPVITQLSQDWKLEFLAETFLFLDLMLLTIDNQCLLSLYLLVTLCVCVWATLLVEIGDHNFAQIKAVRLFGLIQGESS